MFIDFSSRPPLPEFRKTGSHLARYRDVYRTSENLVGEAGDREGLEGYLKTYERLGAVAVIVKGRDLETTFGFRITNEDVTAFCRKHGPRFIGFAGVDPNKGMVAVRELEFAIRKLGLKGLNLQCFEHKLAINDKRMYPLYAKAVELDIPVNVHCGVNFSSEALMAYGRPEMLDEVLVHFPELRLCASPPGWPWTNELVALAWRHPNLRIGIVAVRPKYLAVPDSGYGPLLRYGGTVLQDRIIFGSGFPMMPVERSLDELSKLGLETPVLHKWLCANAANFLGLKLDTSPVGGTTGMED